MPLPTVNSLTHALSLLRPWYGRRHQQLNAELDAQRLSARERARESGLLTQVLRRLTEAASRLPPQAMPGYRYSNGDLLDCLDDQIEALITADALTIADIEALAEARGLFLDASLTDPGELALDIDLAGLLCPPDEVGEAPC